MLSCHITCMALCSTVSVCAVRSVDSVRTPPDVSFPLSQQYILSIPGSQR